ncbi:MAG TPA: AmmeMemoRadiSam system protein A [Gallionella sp.]|nr:AmmeMemoRadiSam system protein A [Gallionella sp.]
MHEAYRTPDTVPLDTNRSLDEDRGRVLLNLARNTIAEKLFPQEAHSGKAAPRLSGVADLDVAHLDWLHQPGATFVTLMLDGELRGCIGSLQAHCALHDDVCRNAAAAAFGDPRFLPLTCEEFSAVEVEVSLLTVPQPLIFTDEADALAQLQPEIDGVVFEYGRYRSTFLPQVWEHFPQPREFLGMLKRKAGLPADFWAEEIRLSRYTVTKWREREFKNG